MRSHTLDIYPEYFARIESGQKTFELRKNDRDFQVGDEIIFDEWDPEKEVYTDNYVVKHIAYILHGGKFGLDPAYSILGLCDSLEWLASVSAKFEAKPDKKAKRKVKK